MAINYFNVSLWILFIFFETMKHNSVVAYAPSKQKVNLELDRESQLYKVDRDKW